MVDWIQEIIVLYQSCQSFFKGQCMWGLWNILNAIICMLGSIMGLELTNQLLQLVLIWMKVSIWDNIWFNWLGDTVTRIVIGLSKTFNSVHHIELLNALENLGITGMQLSWFKSYIIDRKQFLELTQVILNIKKFFTVNT